MTESQYTEALARQDWFYEYTDDHSVWRQGHDSFRQLRAVQPHIDPTGAIWNLFAPPSMRFSKQAVEAA